MANLALATLRLRTVLYAMETRRLKELRKSWNETNHPRDGRGRFTHAPDATLSSEAISDKGKQEIAKKLEDLAVPMEKIEFTRENYNRLFPEGKVQTPMGSVKMGENQFEKLDARDRRELLGAVSQTLKDPVVILGDKQDGKDAKLYIKSFKSSDSKATDYVQSVVVEIEGQNVSISTGQRRVEQIALKIKMASILHYLKGKEGGGPTHETKGENLSIRQQDKVSSNPIKKSRSKKLMIKKSVAADIRRRLGVYT